MVVARYILPEHETPRRKHHEEMVKRLISSPRSRCAANTYIYRSNTDDRERIVGILNQWDKADYSTQATGQIINREAIVDIKEWCSNSSGKDLTVVKKFLQHLTNEKTKNNEEESDFDAQRNGSGTQRSARKPSYNRGNSLPLGNRPGFSRNDSLTNGSFYEGRGNRSGMFQVVRGPPQPEFKKRPATSSSTVFNMKKPAAVGRQSTQPVMRKPDYFEIPATNRSSLSGEVIRQPPQQHEHRPQSNVRPPSNARPATNQSERGRWERSVTMPLSRSSSKIPVKHVNRPFTQNRQNRPTTQGSQRSSESQKFKYSANFHTARDEEIRENIDSEYVRNDVTTPKYLKTHSSSMSNREFHGIEVNQSPMYLDHHPQHSFEVDGFYTEQVPIRKAPARRWQPSQIF